MTPVQRLARFARLDGLRQALLLEATLVLALARVWLVVSPFRKVARRLGTPAAVTDAAPPPLDEDRRIAARSVRWAIERASARVPFRAVCLQQAVAAKLMLARRGIPATVRFGMAPTREPREEPRAHAWVSAGTVKVSGFPLDDDMVAVAQFE